MVECRYSRLVDDDVHLLAAAKLTKSLRVTGIRDDGMHLIEAEMVKLDLYDEITIRPGGEDGVSFVGPHASADIDPHDNLVIAAARLAGVQLSAQVVKNIPAGSGLGGGSSNAAAVLAWAGFDDVETAASIGADVAFCLVGGRAMVRGIGEIIEPLEFISETFTVVTPNIHCSTPGVYAMWDEMGGPVGENGNDLEPAALAFEPALRSTRDALGNATGSTPRLAGSGSSWFVEGAFPDAGAVHHTIRAPKPLG